MSSSAPIPPISGSVTLDVPADRAFDLFTSSFNSWWPHQFHIGAAEVAEVILEPREGGRWYERGVDGTECDWGRVLTCEPPHRLVFTWQINGAFQFDSDPSRASEIEVRFVEGPAGTTTVDVEQRHFDRLEGGQAVHDTISGGGGWALLLDGFAKFVADQR